MAFTFDRSKQTKARKAGSALIGLAIYTPLGNQIDVTNSIPPKLAEQLFHFVFLAIEGKNPQEAFTEVFTNEGT
jgi:hypothetical protein